MSAPYDPDDRLDGAKAIAGYCGFSLRRTFYLLERGELPAGKIGTIWTASKVKLAEHLAKVAAGEAEAVGAT